MSIISIVTSVDKFSRANGSNEVVGENIKKFSIITKLKFLTKFKKSDLVKDFIKNNSFKIDFFTFEIKMTFIYLQKTCIKVLIVHYYKSEYYI